MLSSHPILRKGRFKQIIKCWHVRTMGTSKPHPRTENTNIYKTRSLDCASYKSVETYLAFVPASCANRTSVRKTVPWWHLHNSSCKSDLNLCSEVLFFSPVEYEAPLFWKEVEKVGLESRGLLGLLPFASGAILGALQAVCGGAGEGEQKLAQAQEEGPSLLPKLDICSFKCQQSEHHCLGKYLDFKAIFILH